MDEQNNQNLKIQETNATEEIKETRPECFCQNKDFRNFLTTAAGVFVGGILALSLYGAINKPPVPIMPVHPAPFYHYTPHYTIAKPLHDCPCHRKMRTMYEFKIDEFKKDFSKKLELKKPQFEMQKKFEKPEKIDK